MREAHVGSVMAAYNRVDGAPAAASARLLDETLRKAWGFAGYVVGDCGAVDDIFAAHHAAPSPEAAAAMALRAGTDLDCGRAYATLGPALAHRPDPGGPRSSRRRRLFHRALPPGAVLFGGSDPVGGAAAAVAIDMAAHRQLARQAAARWRSSFLENRNRTLPLGPLGEAHRRGSPDGGRPGGAAGQLSRHTLARRSRCSMGFPPRPPARLRRHGPLRPRRDAGRSRRLAARSPARPSPPPAGATSSSPCSGSIPRLEGEENDSALNPAGDCGAARPARPRRRSCWRRWWRPASRSSSRSPAAARWPSLSPPRTRPRC